MDVQVQSLTVQHFNMKSFCRILSAQNKQKSPKIFLNFFFSIVVVCTVHLSSVCSTFYQLASYSDLPINIDAKAMWRRNAVSLAHNELFLLVLFLLFLSKFTALLPLPLPLLLLLLLLVLRPFSSMPSPGELLLLQ